MYRLVAFYNSKIFTKICKLNSMIEQVNTYSLLKCQKMKFARKFIFKSDHKPENNEMVEISENIKKETTVDIELFNQKVTEAMKLFNFNQMDKSLKLFQEIIYLFPEKMNEMEHIQLGNVYNMIGRIYFNKDDIQKSLEFYNKSLSVMRRYFPQEPENQHKIAEMYYNIGTIKLKYLIEDEAEEDDIYKDDYGNESKLSDLQNPETNKITPNGIVPYKNPSEITFEDTLESFNKARDMINFLIEKYPSNLKKYTLLLKQIHMNLGYLHLNEMDLIKSIEATKDMLESHIKAYGEMNKETVEIGVDISNKLLQFKKFNECVEFTERILNIRKNLSKEYDDNLCIIHYNLFACGISIEKLDLALTNILQLLKIKEYQFEKFQEEIDKKLDFMDVINEENKISEKELINKFHRNSDDLFISKLEIILTSKLGSTANNPHFNQMFDSLMEIKKKREEKLEMKEKLIKAREIEIEENEIEIIKNSENPKEIYLTIKEQKQYELGFINEKICEIYLKKNYRKDAYFYCYDSLKYYENLNVTRLHRTYSNMALIYLYNKNYAKCIDFCKKALFCNSHDMEDLKVNDGELYYMIATSYNHFKDYEKALKYQEKAVKFCELVFGHDFKKYPTLIEKLAFYYKKTGNIYQAEKYYEQAFSLFLGHIVTSNLRKRLCLIAFEIGSIKYDKNDYISALKYYDSIMVHVMKHELTVPKYIIKTINARRKKLFEEAKKYPQEMRKIFVDIDELVERLKIKDQKGVKKISYNKQIMV